MTARRAAWLTSEDWWANWIAGLLLLAAVLRLLPPVPAVGTWTDDVAAALGGKGVGLLALWLALALITGLARVSAGASLVRYQVAFTPIFLLAIVAFLAAEQTGVRRLGLGYAFWAPVLGLLASNTVGTPAWMRDALRGEFFIRIGLVLLGAELLFSRVVSLGTPGLIVAVGVTPIVLVFMFYLGTRVLRMHSPTLVIVVAAATSVCGVSAAVAAAGACRAKKEELMVAVGLTVVFTVLMMIGMPIVLKGLGMDAVVAGALIGGTVDATGAVLAAAEAIGERAAQVAAIVKMMQNMLVGLLAFGIALYWAAYMGSSSEQPRPRAREIWDRLPKFILGFVAASLIFSFVLIPSLGEVRVSAILEVTSELRAWFFCLGFVAIGLDANLHELLGRAARDRAIQLYLAGQAFDVALTLGAAYLAFG